MFDRRPKDLFDDDDPAFGSNHQAIWADGAMHGVGHLVSPRSRGVNELANDARGRRKIDGHGALFRARQERRQSRTANVV